jgi:hypothetical protein
VEYDIYFTEYDFCPVWSRVLIFTHCPIKLIYRRNVGWFRTFIKDQYFSKQTLYTHLLSPF